MTTFSTDNRKSVCLVRKGHMGDVILTEPIARALRTTYNRVVLCTDYLQIARLLDSYDEILPYARYVFNELSEFSKVIVLSYELYPGCHYIDGYAQSAQVRLKTRLPQIVGSTKRFIREQYGLIAPDVSNWIQNMRQWSYSRYATLQHLLEIKLGFPFIMLSPSHSFEEMISLIEHTSCFIGNDSGPAILAQCFSRRAFVIFGATSPTSVLFHPLTTSITIDVGCNGCKHFTRYTNIECATPICLQALTVDIVLKRILGTFNPLQVI